MTKRILLAEDDPTTSLLVARTLVTNGFEVETVANGQEALDAIRHRRPDLLILDLMMPVLDGWSVLRILRDEDSLRQLPVLVLSGAPKDGLRSTKEFGVLFLVKPFDLPVLLAMIEYLTGVLSERARLEGIILAARTIQHYVRNHLSLTVGYCELMIRDPSVPERGHIQARHALQGARSAIEKLEVLARLTNLDTEMSLGEELVSFQSSIPPEPVPTDGVGSNSKR